MKAPVFGLCVLLLIGMMAVAAHYCGFFRFPFEEHQTPAPLTGGTSASQILPHDTAGKNEPMRTGEVTAGKSPSPADVAGFIARAGEYLVRSVEADGRFVYQIDPADPDKPSRKYNLLRHAGAMYALAMYHQHNRSEASLAALRRAGRFLLENCIKPLPGHNGMTALWSDPAITGSRKKASAKLGGAGLALIALLSWEKLQPGAVPRARLEELGRFILFLQKDDGSFYSRFFPGKRGKDDRRTSLFYPGEAILGLAMLYELDGQELWREAALRGLSYLAGSRAGQKEVPSDHWALLATAYLQKIEQENHHSALPQDILRHARQVGRSMLRRSADVADGSPLSGCLTGDGRTCPTAARLEGLAALLRLVPADSLQLTTGVGAVLRKGVGFLIRSQITDGRFTGGLPRRVDGATPGNQKSPGDGAIRIDYVQHALSAVMQFQELSGGRGSVLAENPDEQ